MKLRVKSVEELVPTSSVTEQSFAPRLPRGPPTESIGEWQPFGADTTARRGGQLALPQAKATAAHGSPLPARKPLARS